jgi:hypothetical protein
MFWVKGYIMLKIGSLEYLPRKLSIFIYCKKIHKLLFHLAKWILKKKLKFIVAGCNVVIHIFEPCAFKLEFQHFIYL